MYLVCLSQKASQIWSCKFVDALQPGNGVYMYSKYSMVWEPDQTTVQHGMGTRPQYSMVWEPDYSTVWCGGQDYGTLFG